MQHKSCHVSVANVVAGAAASYGLNPGSCQASSTDSMTALEGSQEAEQQAVLWYAQDMALDVQGLAVIHTRIKRGGAEVGADRVCQWLQPNLVC